MANTREDERQFLNIEYFPHFEVTRWSPKARLAAGASSIGILLVGQRTKGFLRQVTSFAGISLGLRALLNKDLTQVIGILLSPTIRLNREIIVNAPTDVARSFLADVENYPKFMSFVRKVETNRFGNLRWELSGPGGVPISWESFVLSWAPNCTIAWQSTPGSAVFNAGKISIQPLLLGRSKVQVELIYALRAGNLGYAIARILGFDPRTHFKSDLEKMKLLIEKDWETKWDVELPLSS